MFDTEMAVWAGDLPGYAGSMASVLLKPGWSVALYSQDGQRGTSICVSASTAHSPMANAQSLETFHQSTCPANNPPNAPGSPVPPINATNVSAHSAISWTGTDPDPRDYLTYRLYLGTNPNPGT